MTVSAIGAALMAYRDALAPVLQKQSIGAEHVLAILEARDVLHTALAQSSSPGTYLLQEIHMLDHRLKEHAAPLVAQVDFAAYRDSFPKLPDFLLSAKRDAKAAKRFLKKVLNAPHTQFPRVITVDKNAAYPPAIDELKADESLPESTETRQVKYLNNIIEQDHRFIKRRIKPGLGFGSFNTARRTLKGSVVRSAIQKEEALAR